MACILCGGPDHPKSGPHPILNCPTYVSVPQPLKDMIRTLWERHPVTVGWDELKDWIYENLYSPGATVSPHWQYYYSPAGGDPTKLIEERIYMSVKGALILEVWKILKDKIFTTLMGTSDVVQAKHCIPSVADSRPDSIVIYLRSKAAVWRVADEVRKLRQDHTEIVLVGTRYPFNEWFNDTTPPGTARFPDLPGISSAKQPDNPGDSFGGELSAHLAHVFNTRNRYTRMPMLDFMVFCLVFLKEQQVNILRPWHRLTESYVSMFPKKKAFV